MLSSTCMDQQMLHPYRLTSLDPKLENWVKHGMLNNSEKLIKALPNNIELEGVSYLVEYKSTFDYLFVTYRRVEGAEEELWTEFPIRLYDLADLIISAEEAVAFIKNGIR